MPAKNSKYYESQLSDLQKFFSGENTKKKVKRKSSKKKVEDRNTFYSLISLPVVVLILVASGFNFYKGMRPATEYVVVENEADETSYWQEMIIKYPSYRDAYVVLAKLAMKKGDDELKEALGVQIKKIDPFYYESEDVERVLGVHSP